MTETENPSIEEALTWPTYMKRPNEVHMKRMDGPFAVDTAEGRMGCPDGFIAFDPITKQFWAVKVSYARIHYFATGEEM